jgi:hypothetical protein
VPSGIALPSTRSQHSATSVVLMALVRNISYPPSVVSAWFTTELPAAGAAFRTSVATVVALLKTVMVFPVSVALVTAV